MNHLTIRCQTLQLLRAWPGYLPLKNAMDALPDVEVYLCGGVVRDRVLGNARPAKDFDLFFDGPRLDLFFAQLGKSGRMLANAYGNPRWFPSPEGSPYADLIPVSRFHNGLWKCRSIVDVLRQFDCSVNSVGLNLRSGVLLDPQGGIADAASGLLRTNRLDTPATPIVKGAGVTHRGCLWQRINYLARKLGLEIESRTARWLDENRSSNAELRRFTETFCFSAVDV